MEYPFLPILVLILTKQVFAVDNLNDFLIRLAENVTEQVCFMNFDKPMLLDIYTNISVNSKEVPRIIYGNLNSSSLPAKNSFLKECYLTFMEFDNYDSVSICSNITIK